MVLYPQKGCDRCENIHKRTVCAPHDAGSGAASGRWIRRIKRYCPAPGNLQKIFGANTNGFTQNSYRPNPYNTNTAQELDNNRFSGIGKNHLMVDGTESNPKWQYTTKPYNPSFKTPTFENGNT